MQTSAWQDTAKRDAWLVVDKLTNDIAAFSDAGDAPGASIHCLFAGLYLQTTLRWLELLEDRTRPEFAYLVIRRFYDLYRQSVLGHLESSDMAAPPHWRAYHRLARKLTMRSPISTHLVLLSFGAFAHTRHDLAQAVRDAVLEHSSRTGAATSLDRERGHIVGSVTDTAFMQAAQGYIAHHMSQRRGWRRQVLALYALGLRLLKPIWLSIFQFWRRSAYRDAEAWLSVRATRTAEHPEKDDQPTAATADCRN